LRHGGDEMGSIKEDRTMSRRFFVAGCQRSGTTMLRLVLECHPEVYCFDEATGYGVLAGQPFAVPTDRTHIGFKIPRLTECLGDDLAWDEGLPEVAENLYQGEPIIFVTRDVRDTVASMRKLRMTETQSWLEFCAEPILQAKMETTPLGLRYAQEWDRIQAAGRSPVQIGALYWKYKTAMLLEFQARRYPVLPISYEQLTADPTPHLRRVCDFLGIGWTERLLRHDQQPHTEVFPSGLVMGNTDPARAIDTASVNQWSDWLTPEEERDVLAIAGDLNEQIHALHAARSQPRGLLGWLGRKIKGRPRNEPAALRMPLANHSRIHPG